MSILAASLSCHLSKGSVSQPDTLHLSRYHHLHASLSLSHVKFYGLFSHRNTSEAKCGTGDEQNKKIELKTYPEAYVHTALVAILSVCESHIIHHCRTICI